MQTDDIVAITGVINLYPVAVDTRQWRLFDRVFTPDCVVDFGGPARFEGLDALKTAFDAIHQPFKATQHFTSNHQILASGDGGHLPELRARRLRARHAPGRQHVRIDRLVRRRAGARRGRLADFQKIVPADLGRR